MPNGTGRSSMSTEAMRPSTNMVLALFKIKAGRIASVDMLERPVPFGMTSGWVD